MEGWVKLWRKSIDSESFRNPNLWKVWCYCLMRATHKTTKFKFNDEVISLQPGQFVTGRFEGAKDCRMKPSTFRNQISRLIAGGNLDIKSDNRKSIITIVNWDYYQSDTEKEDSTLVENRTHTRRKNELIDLAKILITEVKQEKYLYSIIGKFEKEFGGERLEKILDDCTNRGNTFIDESKLAAYLVVCKRGNGQITDKLKELSLNEPGYV